MRLRLARVLATALALAACDVGPADYVKRPPARFGADRTVTVAYVSDPRAVCLALGAKLEAPASGLVGCHHAGLIVQPNPCTWPNNSDLREVSCHELAHANGWPGDHPQ